MDQTPSGINISLTQKITGILQSKPVILQFFKFAGIGFLTTAFDFLLFNILSKVLQVNAGMPLAIINIFTFVLALAHSFVWNANWTFNNHHSISELKIFSQSVLIGSIGVVGVLLSVVGGANYQVPREVRPERQRALSMKWIVEAARSKKGKPMHEKLAEEIIAASKNEGEAVKKRENTHKMAEANKAFAHFAW
jgi:small subunit ribosomal protein S7